MISLVYDSLEASDLDWVLPDLRERGICATFFVDGESLTADITRWKHAVAEGNALGNGAALSVSMLKDRMSGSAIQEEVDDLQELIAQLSSDPPHCFAISDASGRLGGIETKRGEQLAVAQVKSADELDRLNESKPIVISLYRAHPQLHQHVLEWLSDRLDDIRLVAEI